MSSDGDVVSIPYEPVVDDLDMCYGYGVSTMLYSLHETESHFRLGLVTDFEILQQVDIGDSLKSSYMLALGVAKNQNLDGIPIYSEHRDWLVSQAEEESAGKILPPAAIIRAEPAGAQADKLKQKQGRSY